MGRAKPMQAPAKEMAAAKYWSKGALLINHGPGDADEMPYKRADCFV